MNYQVLARKWRPKSFAELVGQEHVVRALGNALEQNRLHHAYLFTGTRGVGKTTVARILAKALNCETGITATPCGACAACREIDSGRFVDLLELDAASNTGIDNMREVLDNAQYAPTSGRFKVYIIDEVHMLSKAAFNSMLKTLEEPPAHVKFILATTDPQKIPVTVLSRCLQFNLKQMPPTLITTHLQRILEQESIPGEMGGLLLIARAAQGSMRDALSLLDQAIVYGGGRVEEAGVRGMLGAIDQNYLYAILDAVAKGDGPAVLTVAEEMAGRSISFDGALQALALVLHHIALAQTVPAALDDNMPEKERILALAEALDAEAVQLYYQIALLGRRDLSLAPDETAGFTMTLLRMLAFVPEGLSEQGATREDVKQAVLTSTTPVQPGPVTQPREDQEIRQAVSRQPGSGAESRGFDGDWHALVNELDLKGMAKMLAQHCELKQTAPDRWDLRVPEEHRPLMEKSFQERVRGAIRAYLGREIAVEFSLGTVTGMTPAHIDNLAKKEKLAQAIASIEQDPFVREMVESFDARVIESSIKPIDDGRAP